MDPSAFGRPYFQGLNLELALSRGAPNPAGSETSLRLAIANIDYDPANASALRQEWRQCAWAQGGRSDPRVPDGGWWGPVSASGIFVLESGSGVSVLLQRGEAQGQAALKSHSEASGAVSGNGRWRWVDYYERAQCPFFAISEDFMDNELSKRGGLMERIIRFAKNPDGTWKQANLIQLGEDTIGFLGAFDSELFTFKYPAYYRHRALRWRNMDLLGCEVNYYFIGFGFCSLGYNISECLTAVGAWKAIRYLQTPSDGSLYAARAGFYECRNKWETVGPSVIARMSVDDAEWREKMNKLNQMRQH
jgi:hypothetical protein